MTRATIRVSMAVLLLSLPNAAAIAGIADSPLPVLAAGQTTLHLYSVPGVIDAGGLGTFFSCTSTDTSTVQVGVEVFGSNGGLPATDAAATSLAIAAGATRIFGTSNAAGIFIDSNLGAVGLGKGSARILATSKKVACTAFIADGGNAPPTSMVQLTIIAKLKQKAAN